MFHDFILFLRKVNIIMFYGARDSIILPLFGGLYFLLTFLWLLLSSLKVLKLESLFETMNNLFS